MTSWSPGVSSVHAFEHAIWVPRELAAEAATMGPIGREGTSACLTATCTCYTASACSLTTSGREGVWRGEALPLPLEW